MYELWIANKNYSSWSLRPWVLMTTLGIPFEERQVPFGRGSNWDSFRAFSPSGTVPTLRDSDNVVWDSVGIAEYLAERHPGVWPGDPAARAWARCAAAEMHSSFGTLRSRCPMSCGTRVELTEIPPELERDVARIDEIWNQGLGRFGGSFLAGSDFTAVDAFFAPVAFRIQGYGLKLGDVASAYATKLLELPAMKQWYEAALAEAWREPGHEEEIAATGRLVLDLRRPVQP
ncbi:MAG TPA: glutathione S-transferase family protein [Geminicoccus sp.]|uniref:glutathione S-transferase family protein n=1 Tax=Geminicoccus sp. TaxID=2024832 RepID=UPI002E377263|nr:glutathione S-transferase family protein [Geminicoccus sp.]HEX2525970.1 glutathione S-transferase family protein [Geminicoccus sp.]